MNDAMLEKARSQHIYTVADIARSTPGFLAGAFELVPEAAQRLKSEAEHVLERLRRRSECRKFLRSHLIPRKGRSYAKIMTALKTAGVIDLATLAQANPSVLRTVGIGETEAKELHAEALATYNGQMLREIGIPAVSLKKYLAAGVSSAEEFCSTPPGTLCERTGMSLDTVNRHVAKVCAYLNRPAPKTYTRLQIEKGRKELLAVSGISEPVAEKIFHAGIINADSLLASDPQKLSAETGLPAESIRKYQTLIRKKRENAVIQI
jgi:DNA topoisomerase-1